MFETEIAIVLREDMAPWQKLNAAAFLTSGIVGANPGLLGSRTRTRWGTSTRHWLFSP